MASVGDFRDLWDQIDPVGRGSDGGYHRFSWTGEDRALREWFAAQAEKRGMSVECDRNGNQYAWLGSPAEGPAVLTGSHFDSVPGGGAYDGPLGIVSGFLAVDELRAEGFEPARPVVVANFVEEEGGRFGVPCLGSRLATGAITPEKARSLTDRDGVSYAEAFADAGFDPGGMGADPELLKRFSCFVELHVEQGKYLVDTPHPVGVASAIWPHGRWRMDFTGEGNHAGTTRLADRRDPMLTFAFTVLAARKAASLEGALATVGRVEANPNATNAIADRVTGWLDVRAPSQDVLDKVLGRLTEQVEQRRLKDGTGAAIRSESLSAVVDFDEALRDRVAALLGGVPVLPTGAGHDAGVLSSSLPTAMLFVRNPTGVSHAPAEGASDDDCASGVRALANVLKELSR
ncbi:allantoate amidohydrolase [Salininema proteolyticum]|uniref:Allantoate amidohydrolase n=1 Tax=Salininema proteolyticum TaxID=1607685 RepID=A0ABV8TW83_9ACTN